MLFFAKNSLTDMSRCFAAIDSAVTASILAIQDGKLSQIKP